MARHYELTMAAWWTEIEAALRDFYVDGAEITYVSSDGIVFRVQAICDLYCQIALSEVSSTNANIVLQVSPTISPDTGRLTNATVIAKQSGSPGSQRTGIHLVLADNFILYQAGSTVSYSAYTSLIAKCSNGRSLFANGVGTGGNDGQYRYCMYADELTALSLRFVAPAITSMKSNKKEVLYPSYFGIYPEMELNEDGTFVHIPGLYLTTREVGYTPIVGANYYIGLQTFGGKTTVGMHCLSPFFVELETEEST